MIKSRLEISKYPVLQRERFIHAECTTSSKGVVEKYTDGEVWVKTDSRGYETLAEVLASRVVTALGFDAVRYEPGFLATDDYSAETVCISQSYIHPGEEEMSIGRLLQIHGGFVGSNEMYSYFSSLGDTPSKVAWVVDTLKDIIDPVWLKHSLAVCVWLDSLLLNEDRHLFNLVLVRNADNKFRFINFDYGASLLSDLKDYSLSMPLHIAMSKVKSKPFSVDFGKQLKAFASELPPTHNDSIVLAVGDLYAYHEKAHIQRCIDVLHHTLQQNGISLRILGEDTKTSCFF